MDKLFSISQKKMRSKEVDKIPSLQNGFIAAVVSTVMGYVLFIIIEAFTKDLGSMGAMILTLFTILSVIITIESFQSMNYWGIMYLVGWLFGMISVGIYFLDLPELVLSFGVGFLYLLVKLKNKG